MKMASVRDTATFFSNGSASQFKYVLSLYPQALKLKAESKIKKPEELIKLDNWYQNELPKKIKARGKDAHLNHEELVQLMKWKQARGKAYPQLNYLVKVNTPRAVMTETKKAFRKLPNLEQAITALSNLKGVGTTMASALLAAAAPEAAPFMADECLMAIPEIEGIDYTTKEYMNFVQHIRSTADRLNKEAPGQSWTVHQVELALWTHFVASELRPELLDAIPGLEGGGGGGGGGGGETNGKGHTNGEAKSEKTDTKTGKKGESNHKAATAATGNRSDEEDEGDETVEEEESSSRDAIGNDESTVEEEQRNGRAEEEETSSSSNAAATMDESSSSRMMGQTEDVDENAQEPPSKKLRAETNSD